MPFLFKYDTLDIIILASTLRGPLPKVFKLCPWVQRIQESYIARTSKIFLSGHTTRPRAFTMFLVCSITIEPSTTFV